MSTNPVCSHNTNKQQHHKSKSTQKVPPTLQLHNANTNNASININTLNTSSLSPSSPASTASSSSYTLCTPTSPLSPQPTPLPQIAKATTTKRKKNNKNRTRSRSRSRSRAPKTKLKKKQLNNNNTYTPPSIATACKYNSFSKSPTRASAKYQLTLSKSPTLNRNTCWRGTGTGSKKKQKKEKKHMRNNTTTKIPNPVKTLPKLKHIKSVNHKKRKNNKNNNNNKKIKHSYRSKTQKRLKLKKTSLSEKSRTMVKNKKNYYYYSKPNDLFNDNKPLSRQPSHKQIVGKNKKKRKKKTNNNKKIHNNNKNSKKEKGHMKKKLSKRKMQSKRPLSTRISDKSPTADMDMKFNDMNEMDMDMDMDDDTMQYIQYEVDMDMHMDMDIFDGISHMDDTDELNTLLSAIKQDIECKHNMDDSIHSNDDETNNINLPFLQLTHSLSDGIGSCNNKLKESNSVKKKIKKRKKTKNKRSNTPVIRGTKNRTHMWRGRANSRSKSPKKLSKINSIPCKKNRATKSPRKLMKGHTFENKSKRHTSPNRFHSEQKKPNMKSPKMRRKKNRNNNNNKRSSTPSFLGDMNTKNKVHNAKKKRKNKTLKSQKKGHNNKENKPKTVHKYNKKDTKTPMNGKNNDNNNNHIRSAVSMENIKCITPKSNKNMHSCENISNASPPIFFPRKISEYRFNNRSMNSMHFTPSLPASPRFWNNTSPSTPKTPQMFHITPDDFVHHIHENEVISPNAARRNTIGITKGKKTMFTFDSNDSNVDIMNKSIVKSGTRTRGKKSNYATLSLSALAHYFQYDTNHETKSVLAVLAKIIMELVGEPNVFKICFKVRPEVGMAIRRNKLRISPVLHRGLVLSFCVHNMPQQLQHNYDYKDSPLYEESYDNNQNNNDDPYQLEFDLYDEQNEHENENENDYIAISPSPKEMPTDFNLSSSSDEDRDDIKTDDNENDMDMDMRDSDSNNTSHYIDCNSSPSPPPTHNNNNNNDRSKSKSKSKSKHNNTNLSPHNVNDSDDDLMDDNMDDMYMDLNAYKMNTSNTSYSLPQSLTKTTNSPSDSPGPILNENEEVIVHEKILRPRRSNSDIFDAETLSLMEQKQMDYVGLFRNENIKHNHVYEESDSFSMDINDITSPYFHKEIRSNTYNEDASVLERCPSHMQSGSDMTVISVSADTISHHKKHSSTYNYDNYDNYNNSNTSLNDVTSDTPDMNIPSTQIPSFQDGYDTHTGSTNVYNSYNSNAKLKEKGNGNGNDNEVAIFARNVRLPSAEYMKQNMKARNSIEKDMNGLNMVASVTSPAYSNHCKYNYKLTDHTTIPDKSYDSSQDIEYNEYEEDEQEQNAEDRTSKFDEFKNNQIEELQLTLRPSITNSIPLRTIQVTTPNRTHIQVLSHNDDMKQNRKSVHKMKKLSPIQDAMNDDLKEFDIIDTYLNENTKFPLNDYKSATDSDENDDYKYGYDENDDNDHDNTPHRRMPTLTRKNSQKKPTLSYISKSQSNSGRSSNRSRSNRTLSATPKFARKPALNLSMRSRKKGHRPRSQTCTNFENGFFNDCLFGGNEPDLYESIVIDNGSFLSRNISMTSASNYYNNGKEGNIIKFEKPFNKMVADESGNIFIGTDKYIRYITYNNHNKPNKVNKYGKFRKQEKLLYELKYDEHLVSLWNQDGKIYFVTMPYALQDNHYKEYNKTANNNLVEEWSLQLYVVENKNNLRQRSINKYEWIPPSVHDKLPYRKLKTFRWKVRGRFIDNFLSIWYDEKYETLITLVECDRLNAPQIIFLNKRNNKGLVKLKIRNNTVSIHGSTNDTHDNASNNQNLLIRHKPTKSWLCCISCIDRNEYKRKQKQKQKIKNKMNEILRRQGSNYMESDEEECWIQFRLNRECNKITSSKIIKLPRELRCKKWLSYDEYRDCLIGINRLGIEELLECGFETKIELFVVPRLTKLLQQNAMKQIFNGKKPFKKKRSSLRNKRGRSSSSANNRCFRKRSHSQKRGK